MKILQLCTKVPYPALDGGSIAILNLARGLVNTGHVVHILAMNTPKHYQNSQLTDEKLRMTTVDVDTRIKPLHLFRNLIFSEQPYIAERFISKAFSRKLIELIEAENYEIIQLEGLYLAPYIPVIRKYSRSLIAFRAHNIEHEIWERSLVMEKGLRKVYLKNMSKRLARFEKSFITQYDLLVPITQRDLESFIRMGNTKPAWVSPTGIDISDIPPEIVTEEFPSLFFLGALDWFPNQEGLVWFLDHVWDKIHSLYPNLPLYIAGRNAPVWLEKKLQLPNITYLGEIKDAHTFMQSKGIMIVPLFSGSGMRIKIIEGMALGKVVMATPIAAEGIQVCNDENIIIVENENDFVARLQQLLNNREFYQTIKKNANKFIMDNYDNTTISLSLAKFYQSNMK